QIVLLAPAVEHRAVALLKSCPGLVFLVRVHHVAQKRQMRGGDHGDSPHKSIRRDRGDFTPLSATFPAGQVTSVPRGDIRAPYCRKNWIAKTGHNRPKSR